MLQATSGGSIISAQGLLSVHVAGLISYTTVTWFAAWFASLLSGYGA